MQAFGITSPLPASTIYPLFPNSAGMLKSLTYIYITNYLVFYWQITFLVPVISLTLFHVYTIFIPIAIFGQIGLGPIDLFLSIFKYVSVYSDQPGDESRPRLAFQ